MYEVVALRDQGRHRFRKLLVALYLRFLLGALSQAVRRAFECVSVEAVVGESLVYTKNVETYPCEGGYRVESSPQFE